LRVPFEIFRVRGTYLSLRHPVFRHVLEGRSGHSFSTVLGTLMHRDQVREPFRAIFVNPYVGSSLQRAKSELRLSQYTISQWCSVHHIPLDLKVIEGPEATCENLEEVLHSAPRVHLLHFCGHGTHNGADPDESGLLFVGSNAQLEPVTCRRIFHILEDAKLGLAYLSCCYSGATSLPTREIGYDFLGVAQAVLTAGVSNVLSFRWRVSDAGAEQFADQFYKHLFSDPPSSLAQAVRESRRWTDSFDHWCDAWASPLLISNNR
jgi:CHAT domain-containing protein